MSLVLARLGLGFGEGATFPVSTRAMSDWSRKEDHGYVQGIAPASARLGKAIPMDIAPKFSGSASGLMNTGSALAAIISPPVFGYLVDLTHSWQIPFLGSIGLLVFGSVFAFWMNPDRPLILEDSAGPSFTLA